MIGRKTVAVVLIGTMLLFAGCSGPGSGAGPNATENGTGPAGDQPGGGLGTPAQTTDDTGMAGTPTEDTGLGGTNDTDMAGTPTEDTGLGGTNDTGASGNVTAGANETTTNVSDA